MLWNGLQTMPQNTNEVCFLHFGERKTGHLWLFKRAKPDFLNYEVRDLPNRFAKKHKNIPLLCWVAYNQKEYTDAMKKADNIIFQDFEPKI